MILRETILKCADNSGALALKCINPRGGFRRSAAVLGNPVTVVVRQVEYKKKLLKKSIYTGLIVATKQPTRRLDGSYLRSDNNRCLILDEASKFMVEFINTN
jgi:large subunit ribosomal protein L14